MYLEQEQQKERLNLKNQTWEVEQLIETQKIDIEQHQESIVGRQIPNFKCLGCGTDFNGRIEGTGSHKKSCLWNYFVQCPDCHYQSNLAKVIGFNCRGCTKFH